MGSRMLATMAWRNLWRRKRRTLITASSIAFSVLLAVFVIGINDQSWEDVINTAARIGGGHITVQHPDYQDKPALNRTVRRTAQKIDRIRAVAHVVHASPRIVGELMLATASGSYGAGFIAYDPAVESTDTLSILEAVSGGRPFATSRDRGIVLGYRLARNLDAKLGSRVVYTLTDRSGEIVSGLARVSGLVKTGSPAVDLGLCFLPIDSLRQALGYQADEATQIAVFVDSQRRSAAVTGEVAGTLDDQSVALNWKQLQPDLASFIAMKKGGGTFFSLLILVLCAAGIFNTLFVSVMERLREFGILIAIGLSPGKLFSLVMLESAWLGLVGLACGVLISAYPYYYFSTVGLDLTEMYAAGGQSPEVAGVAMSMVLKIGLYPESVVAITVIILGATMISGLYPAWRAGKVRPVETIKLG